MKQTLSTLLFTSASMTLAGFAYGGTWVEIPTLPNAAQCVPEDINNSGLTVGNCTANSGTKNSFPWVADGATHTQQVTLPYLVTGQPCGVWGISNNAIAIGSCRDALSASYAVRWNTASPSSAPEKLDALPATLLLPLLRPKDKYTAGRAYNDQGDVVGNSYNADNDGTAVFYPNGVSTPTRVSNWDDNCRPSAVNLPTSGNLMISLNCPNNQGSNTAKVAEKNGASFTITNLTIPTGANFCTVVHVNNRSQFIGTCHYPNEEINVTSTAFWSSKTATPILLTLSSGSKNAAITLNNSGIALVTQVLDDGKNQYMIWLPMPPLPLINIIVLPNGATSARMVGLSSNNRVALDTYDASKHIQACTWTLAGGAICLSPINGGLNSSVTALSENGSYIAGQIIDSSENTVSATSTTP